MSEPKLRTQTKSWLTAISTDLRRTAEQETVRLRASVEQSVAAIEKAASAKDQQLDELAMKIASLAEETTQEAVAQARAGMEATAQAELTALRNRLQSQLDTAQKKFEAAQSALESKLEGTEREVAAVRKKRDELAAGLEQMLQRLTTLEKKNGDETLRRQLAEARLEEEVQRRITFEKQLETSRQEIVLAKAEAESSRLESYLMGERMRTLEHAPTTAAETKVTPSAPKNKTSKLASVPRPPAVEDQKRAPDADSNVIGNPSEFAANRRVKRVNIVADNAVLVDGVASVLVDISTLGAQVLSPATLRPNRTVRLMLKTAEGTCAVEGRIVWAHLESASAQAAAQYRAGMQFTTTNQATINAWVNQQRAPQVAAQS